MVKSELINLMIKNNSNFSEREVTAVVNHTLEFMSEVLSYAGRVEIRGFGTFSLHYRPPRRARNPQTGEEIRTEAKYVPFFKPGKELREMIQGK